MRMGSTIQQLLTTVCCWGCMLDIIWNAVEDEYLTVIMYLLCSIPMKFSGKTSQMIHNERDNVRSRTAYLKTMHVSGAFEQSPAGRTAVCLAGRLCLEPHGRDPVRPTAGSRKLEPVIE